MKPLFCAKCGAKLEKFGQSLEGRYHSKTGNFMPEIVFYLPFGNKARVLKNKFFGADECIGTDSGFHEVDRKYSSIKCPKTYFQSTYLQGD